jgi:riboflavin biosynthesis pyrimidine reductase
MRLAKTRGCRNLAHEQGAFLFSSFFLQNLLDFHLG